MRQVSILQAEYILVVKFQGNCCKCLLASSSSLQEDQEKNKDLITKTLLQKSSSSKNEEVLFIKKIQTLILVTELIATLVKRFEEHNNNNNDNGDNASAFFKQQPSSPTNDALLIDLYDCWSQLTSRIESLVEKGFVKGRGQSRIRGRDFQLWLEKFRKSIELEDEEDDDEVFEETDERGNWFDVMQDRIRMLCVGRE